MGQDKLQCLRTTCDPNPNTVVLTPKFTQKGSFDAETVHAVNVESLREEFAEILTTKEIIEALQVVQQEHRSK